MNTPFTKHTSKQHQSGAALVVALVLLVALSLMAISSMNTASLDLIMAGNEQYRSRAFVSAETGIEAALDLPAAFDSAKDYNSGGGATPAIVDTGVGKYSYAVTRPNNGIAEVPPPGNSEGKFGAIHFQIASTGISERNATSTNTQGLFQVVQDLNEEETYSDDACAGKTTLDATSTGC